MNFGSRQGFGHICSMTSLFIGRRRGIGCFVAFYYLLPLPFYFSSYDLVHGNPNGEVKLGMQDSSRTQSLGQMYKTCHPDSYIKDQVYLNQCLIMHQFIHNPLCHQHINNRPNDDYSSLLPLLQLYDRRLA